MKSKTVKGIKEDYSVAKKEIKAEFNKAKAKVIEAEQHVESYISENPKKATAIAVGLGVAIGAAVTAYWMKQKKSE